MWQKFLLILTDSSIQFEFSAVPTPLLKLLRSPEGGFVASNKDLWWERPIDDEWVRKASALAKKFAVDGARIEDLRTQVVESSSVIRVAENSADVGAEPLTTNECRDSLYQIILHLQEEVAELKKFDVIAYEKLSLLKLQLESDQKPKARVRSSSKVSGQTKSSS